MEITEFETLECCNCGIVFQVPIAFDDNRIEDGREFFCPNGHGQSYEDTEEENIDKLKEENKNLQIQIRQLKCIIARNVGMRDKIKLWWKGKL